MLMQNNFSKCREWVPRGTSQHKWRWLTTLLLILTLGIGQMWADEIFGFTVTSSTTAKGSYSATGGTAECTGSAMSTGGSNEITVGTQTFYKFSSSSQWTFTLSSGKFAAGDVISFTGACTTSNKTGKGFAIQTSPVIAVTGDFPANKSNVVSYTVVADDGIAGQSSFSIKRNDSDIKFGTVSVTRSSGGGEDPVCPSGLSITSKNDKTAFLEGDAIELTAALTAGNGAITYQWYKGGTAEGNKLTGKTAAKLEIASCVEGDAGDYYCVASKSDCSDAVNTDAFTITVAHNPCATHHWFVATADATANGKTNWDGFTNAVTGSNGQTNSVTIDGTTYNLTKRTGSTGGGGTILGFTIPANKAGTLYGYMKSSGSAARTLSLKKGDDVVKTNTEIVDGNWTLISIDAIAPGTYTLSPDQNVQVQMFVLKICDATFHTITLDLDGGSGATSIQALDGAPATKPADPTKEHCTFAGWVVESTSAAYDWTENVTGDLTLKATWTQLYTISFDAGEGSGDAPAAIADKAAGETFEVPANTFTAPASKEFDKWNDGTNDYAPGATYTVGTANVVLTALWKAASAKYTVHYMDEDGTTPLGDDELVEVGEHPAGISATKPLYTFASWQLSGSDIALSAVSAAANEEVTLTARWAKAYAQDVDLEGLVEASGKSADWQAYLSGKGYSFDTEGDISLDAKASGKSYENWPYQGLKMKKAGAYVEGRIAADKLVIIKLGHMAAAANVSLDGVAAGTATGLDADEPAGQLNYFYVENESVLRYETTNGGACVLKAITITNPFQVTFNANGGEDVASLNGTPSVTLPSATKGTDSFLGWFDAAEGGNLIGEAGDSYTPTATVELFAHWEAVSTDARLASISFSSDAGTLSPAFDPEVTSYTYTMPYGTAAIPTITGATSVNVNAQDPIIGEAAAAWGDAQTIKGVAESGDKKTYTITMKVAPKDGVSIIKVATTGGTNKTVTGLYAGDGDVKLSGDTKMNDGNYIGFILDGTTLQAGDRINVHTTTAANTGGSHVIFFDNMTDKNELYETGEIGGLGDNIFTINAAMVGATTAYVYRSNADAAHKWNGYVDYIEVTRAMNPVLKSIQFNSTDVAVSSTSVSATLPYGTNLGTMTITPEIIWNGAAAENSILINGSATGAWAWGENTYKLTDKDGDATTYTITLTEAAHYEAQIGTTGYATLVAAVAAAQADDVVKLLDNVDLMATGLTIAENITLDLNGFNIKAGEQIDNDIVVPAGKKLTLVDNSANAEGKIYTEQAYTGSATGYGVVRVAGEFLMQSGNIYAVIESDPANLGQFAVVLGAGGKATIEGGQIKAGWYAISNNGNNTGSTIIVSGGELISTADFAIYNPAKESTVTVSGGVVYGAAGGIAMNRGELTVTGGTITSKDQGTTGTWGDGTGGMSNAAISASGKYESVEVEISGGTIIAEGTAVMITNGTTNPVEVAISGGQFSHVVPAEYCAPGFAPVTEPNAQGKYEVEDKRIYIFDGSTMSNMATSPSGAIAWEIVGSTMSAGDKDKIYNDVHYTRALSCGSSSTTKHFKIDVALNNAAKIEVIGMSNSSSDTRHAWLTNSTEKGDFADAIASLATTGYNPEMFTTDWLEEGSYYLHSDNTVAIFLIRVTEKAVDPKCEIPTITTQPATDLTFGAGNMTATVEAEVSDEGTLTYQWYNAANDEAVVGQTTATLTTDDEGTYYVIVTNTKASHRDNSIKSENASLAHRVMNDATLSALSVSAGTLAPAFDPAVENYTVNLAMGTTDVPTLTATATMNGYANVAKNEATEFVNYEAVSTVVVTSEDLSATKTYTVHYYVAHQITTLVDVTESTVWDWTTITARADGSVIDQTIGTKQYGPSVATADGLILANYVLGGDNWDKIEGNDGAYAIRSSSNQFYQGASLHFHSTKGGYLTIRARNEGHDMILKVQNAGRDMNLGDLGDWKNYVIYVKAGDVVIYNVPASSNYPMRVAKITFTEDETPDYPRVVTNNFGTLCVDHNVVAGGALGATFYQIASRNELYNDKIDFEEVLPGEELKAGEPYIFQSTTGTIELYYGETVADDPVPVRGMIGNYAAGQLAIDEDNQHTILYIAQNKLWSCENLVGGYLTLNPNRAYIDMTQVPTYAEYTATPQQGNAPRRRVTLGKDAQQNATGLENLVGGEQAQKLIIDGQMYILRGEKLYDATGRLVK